MTNYYKENIVEDIDVRILRHPEFLDWYMLVEDILKNDEFQKRKLFMHHPNLSVWDHSIYVSFKSYLAAGMLHANRRNAAIAGLLHDFYPQAWISTPDIEELDGGIYALKMKQKTKLFEKHGFVHAKEASENYLKYFPELENEVITNSIKRHMFPLTPVPPKYLEGWIVTMVDKVNSTGEVLQLNKIPAKTKKVFVTIFHRN